MRTVEVSRWIRASPPEIRRSVDPARLVELEGTFRVKHVSDDGPSTQVIAQAGGMDVEFAFEAIEDGYRYEQAGQAGPFDSMVTTVTIRPKDDGSLVRATSRVSLGLPLPGISDRIAAWKRRGELERALETLANDLE